MRQPLTHDHVLDLERTYDDAAPEELLELAERLFVMAEESQPGDEIDQSTLHALAGQYFRDGGDLTRAEHALTLAARTPSRSDAMDPRCFLVGVYLAQRRLADAANLDNVLRKSRMEELPAYSVLGEIWHEHDPQRALGWYNRGIELAERTDDVEGAFTLLCMGRWSVRKELGHDPDAYDRIAQHAMRTLKQAGVDPSR